MNEIDKGEITTTIDHKRHCSLIKSIKHGNTTNVQIPYSTANRVKRKTSLTTNSDIGQCTTKKCDTIQSLEIETRDQ